VFGREQLRRKELTDPLLGEDGWKLDDDRFSEGEVSASIQLNYLVAYYADGFFHACRSGSRGCRLPRLEMRGAHQPRGECVDGGSGVHDEPDGLPANRRTK
jgi:hypothetical protein